MIEWLKDLARIIKQDVHALYLASQDPRVPQYAKAMDFLVAGYALSPIDLNPDFIRVLGYVDDLILVPLGVLLAIRLIPCSSHNCRNLDCLRDDLWTACPLPFRVTATFATFFP